MGTHGSSLGWGDGCWLLLVGEWPAVSRDARKDGPSRFQDRTGSLWAMSSPQVAGAGVSVRQPTDPSAVKVGEAALAGARCGEVDTDVVQVEAPLTLCRDCLHGH